MDFTYEDILSLAQFFALSLYTVINDTKKILLVCVSYLFWAQAYLISFCFSMVAIMLSLVFPFRKHNNNKTIGGAYSFFFLTGNSLLYSFSSFIWQLSYLLCLFFSLCSTNEKVGAIRTTYAICISRLHIQGQE